MATRSQIETLQEEWLRDPSWRIEDAPGYEKHRDELSLWAKERRDEREKAEIAGFLADAKRIGCADNPLLAEYVFNLELRLRLALETIRRLEEELGKEADAECGPAAAPAA